VFVVYDSRIVVIWSVLFLLSSGVNMEKEAGLRAREVKKKERIEEGED
jgi:hypothetical protein